MQRLAIHALYVVGAIVLGFYALSRIFPAPQPVHDPVAVITPSPVERTAQAGADSYRAYQQILNSVNRWETAENMAMSALQAAYAKRISVDSKLHTDSTPQPMPTASKHLDRSDLSAIYGVTRRATQSVLNDPETHVNTNVKIDNVEIPPGRISTTMNSLGDPGIGVDIYRRGQYNVTLAGVRVQQHIDPEVSAQYILPHTKLSAGFGFLFDHNFEPVISIQARF